MSLSSLNNLDRRVAVLGCGYWGRNLVRNFSQLGALSVVVDPSPQGREEAHSLAPEAEILADPSALWSRDDIHGIVIATPAPTHYDLACEAFAAGKDVMVEKPMAMNADEGERLVAAAAEHDRLLMVGHLLEHHPAVRRLYELVAEGALGKLRYIQCRRLNMGKIRTAENALWSLSPHDLSVMLRLAGAEPESVECHGQAFIQPEVADVVHAHLNFPGGVQGYLQASWLNPFKEQRIVVVGEERMAVFDDTLAEGKLQLFAHQVEFGERGPVAKKVSAEIVDYPEQEPLKAECQHFLQCMQDRKQPFTDGQSGQLVMRTLEACQRSMDAEAKVDLANLEVASL
ncbi:MAG: oxidoreductase domain-containing protein [Puniceicoccaceae bacterium 5H]|nr:MAG: oxidoreductase domain-containing protein [Puniceicoccaceae bacterium 5H]